MEDMDSTSCPSPMERDNFATCEDTNNPENALPGYESFNSFFQCGTAAVGELTKMSQGLPSGRKWNLLTNYTSFPQLMNNEGERILNIISFAMKNQRVKGRLLNRCIEEQMDVIIECNDTIIDKADINMDEMEGIRQNPGLDLTATLSTPTISGSWNTNRRITENTSFSSRHSSSPVMSSPTAPSYHTFSNKNIEKPQIKYKYNIDNSPEPFKPKLVDKPNSRGPLAILLDMDEDGECYTHPYQYELDLFTPPKSQLKEVQPCIYKPLADTPLIYVENINDLKIALDDLKKYSEISIDLEHHNYRTYLGLTCLMQISTRDTDYIIDTLVMRDNLQSLNEVFTDPKVVKIFHGADLDIEWLQRDLGLYIVNMFDTHIAARVLNFGKLSLAYLLQHYCNVKADKQYQLADWRVRPLPEELLKYAREDTHYLLYIYDRMKNALLEAGNGEPNVLVSVIQQSTDICKKRYKKPVLTDDAHMDLVRRGRKLFDNQQLYALKELYKWRDSVARKEDESILYVLQNHMMLKIAENLPREMQGLLACCNPIPHFVRKHLPQLHDIVNKAKTQPLVKPVFEEEVRARTAVTLPIQDIRLEGPLHCPHDLSHIEDFRPDLPTLLRTSSVNENGIQTTRTQHIDSLLCNSKPSITVFESSDITIQNNDFDDIYDTSTSEQLKLVKFLSPYERYKKVRPFVDSQNIEEAEEQSSQQTGNMATEDDLEQRMERIREHYLQAVNNSLENKSTPSLQLKEEKDDKKHLKDIVKIPSTTETSENVTPEPLRNQVSKKRKHLNDDKVERTNIEFVNPVQNLTNNADLVENDITDNSLITKKKKRKKNKEKTGNSTKKEKKQKRQEFTPFDYSTVNYSRFHGGSSAELNQQNIKSKFKRKDKKMKFLNKSNIKSMTFGKHKEKI